MLTEGSRKTLRRFTETKGTTWTEGVPEERTRDHDKPGDEGTSMEKNEVNEVVVERGDSGGRTCGEYVPDLPTRLVRSQETVGNWISELGLN